MKALVLLPLFLSVLSMGQVSNRQNQLAGMKPPCPNAEIVETEFKAHYTEVEYRCNDKIIEVAYDEHNNIIYTESETKIPQETRQKIIRKLDKSFEDLAIAGDHLYVLRSDGTIFSFNHRNFNGKVEQTVAPTKCTNIEGLCFDAEKNLLLMACKSAPVNGSTDTRLLYSMPREKIHHTTINTVISREEINKMMFKKYGGLMSGNSGLQFNPSAIAVHPKTGQRYMLSASNRLLAIYDNNKLLDVFPLPSELYYKPEGLAFSDNGGLYISSEGMKNGAMSGRIFYFRRR